MEKTVTQDQIIDNRSELYEKMQAAWEWAKEHKKDIAIGGLSFALLVVIGKYHGRGTQIQELIKKNGFLSAKNGQSLSEISYLKDQLSEFKKAYYSLASDATRHRSSLGGQILADAKYSNSQLYS